jgi:alkaline phosphatase
MKNRTIFTGFSLLFCFLISVGALTANEHVSEPENLTKSSLVIKKPSVIILIGDGMGPEHIEYGRLVEYGENGNSSINEFPYQTLVSTDEYYGSVTDSAAAATGISTGVITTNGRIGQDKDGNEIKTILEIAEDNGYQTGIISTTQINHATPASFAAHENSRNNYVNIAADMALQNIEILFGGGASDGYFGTQISNLQASGYGFATDKFELVSQASIPAFGLFSSGGLLNDRILNHTSSIPTLLDMTKKAVELITADDQPFFLLVEGGQIDWESHNNMAPFVAQEMIEFEKTVRYIKTLAEADPFLQVIVTADHETGGLSINSYDFNTQIPGENDDLALVIEKRTKRSTEIGTSFASTGHTSLEVIMTGMGPYTEQINNANHTSDAFFIMQKAIGANYTVITDPTPTNSQTSQSSKSSGLSIYLHIFSIFFLIPLTRKIKKQGH